MCDTYINGVGYICNECKEEFKNFIRVKNYDISNKYELLKGILDKIRNGIIKNDSDSQISFVKNFYNNTRLMDFQMLPSNLKNELTNKFNNFI